MYSYPEGVKPFVKALGAKRPTPGKAGDFGQGADAADVQNCTRRRRSSSSCLC